MNDRHRQTGPLAAVIDQTRSLAESLGRDDLAARLETTIGRVLRPGVRVVVVGEFKQGKSTMVNALLGTQVCPVDDDVATSVLTHISHAPEPRGLAHRRANETDSGAGSETQIETRVDEIDPGDAAHYVSEEGNPNNTRQLVRVEFGLPAPLLEAGLELVDTPGVGGLESAHGAITIGALSEADAVIFVTDASQEITQPELDFLAHAHELCPTVIHAVSKIDLYPEWRRILELSETHLRRAGLAGPVVGISSTLYQLAQRLGDEQLRNESGLPALLDTLRHTVIDPGDLLVLRSGLNDVRSVAVQLAAPLESEVSILRDPTLAAGVIADFEAAKARAEQLRGQSSRWQVTLNDGVSDLQSDIDHDLRARTRSIIQQSEASIDESDPADMWDEFESNLYTTVTGEIVENFALLTNRVDDLVSTVEEHFAVAEQELSHSFGVAAPVAAVEGLTIESSVDLNRAGIIAQGMTGLRGSYGGVLMFTMIGNMIGMAALNPAVLVIGLVMGRKSLRDEKSRMLTTRRQQAKAAVRKYVDEVSFQVGKDSRDSLRLTQRQLRDHFTARADELTRSTQQAVMAAQDAARADEASKQSRLDQLDKWLARVRAIEQQCDSIRRAIDAPRDTRRS